MDWTTAWQLASEIVDLLAFGGVTVTAQEQERIANHIHKRGGYKFNAHHQEWYAKVETKQ